MNDPEQDAIELRQRYLELRRAGIPQAQMAEVTGLPESTISMWLSGHRPLARISVMSRLVRALPGLKVLA